MTKLKDLVFLLEEYDIINLVRLTFLEVSYVNRV